MVDLILAHNTHDRPKTLTDTISADLALNPTSTYVSLTSTGKLSEDLFKSEKVDVILIPGIYHQIDCINAFYGLVSLICGMHDDGIVIFTHDDVRLLNESVVKKNIEYMLENDLSYMVRNPTNYGADYYMMECVYLRIKNIKEVFKTFTTHLLKTPLEIPLDQFNKPSAEAWLAKTLKETGKGEIVKYFHGDNEVSVKHLIDNMGYTHLNYGVRAWKE